MEQAPSNITPTVNASVDAGSIETMEQDAQNTTNAQEMDVDETGTEETAANSEEAGTLSDAASSTPQTTPSKAKSVATTVLTDLYMLKLFFSYAHGYPSCSMADLTKHFLEDLPQLLLASPPEPESDSSAEPTKRSTRSRNTPAKAPKPPSKALLERTIKAYLVNHTPVSFRPDETSDAGAAVQKKVWSVATHGWEVLNAEPPALVYQVGTRVDLAAAATESEKDSGAAPARTPKKTAGKGAKAAAAAGQTVLASPPGGDAAAVTTAPSTPSTATSASVTTPSSGGVGSAKKKTGGLFAFLDAAAAAAPNAPNTPSASTGVSGGATASAGPNSPATPSMANTVAAHSLPPQLWNLRKAAFSVLRESLLACGYVANEAASTATADIVALLAATTHNGAPVPSDRKQVLLNIAPEELNPLPQAATTSVNTNAAEGHDAVNGTNHGYIPLTATGEPMLTLQTFQLTAPVLGPLYHQSLPWQRAMAEYVLRIYNASDATGSEATGDASSTAPTSAADALALALPGNWIPALAVMVQYSPSPLSELASAIHAAWTTMVNTPSSALALPFTVEDVRSTILRIAERKEGGVKFGQSESAIGSGEDGSSASTATNRYENKDLAHLWYWEVANKDFFSFPTSLPPHLVADAPATNITNTSSASSATDGEEVAVPPAASTMRSFHSQGGNVKSWLRLSGDAIRALVRSIEVAVAGVVRARGDSSARFEDALVKWERTVTALALHREKMQAELARLEEQKKERERKLKEKAEEKEKVEAQKKKQEAEKKGNASLMMGWLRQKSAPNNGSSGDANTSASTTAGASPSKSASKGHSVTGATASPASSFFGAKTGSSGSSSSASASAGASSSSSSSSGGGVTDVLGSPGTPTPFSSASTWGTPAYSAVASATSAASSTNVQAFWEAAGTPLDRKRSREEQDSSETETNAGTDAVTDVGTDDRVQRFREWCAGAAKTRALQRQRIRDRRRARQKALKEVYGPRKKAVIPALAFDPNTASAPGACAVASSAAASISSAATSGNGAVAVSGGVQVAGAGVFIGLTDAGLVDMTVEEKAYHAGVNKGMTRYKTLSFPVDETRPAYFGSWRRRTARYMRHREKIKQEEEAMAKDAQLIWNPQMERMEDAGTGAAVDATTTGGVGNNANAGEEEEVYINVAGKPKLTPRVPWGVDVALFDYAFDSEEEWVQSGDEGVDLNVDSDGEEEEEEEEAGRPLNELDYEDGWLCHDDVLIYEEGVDVAKAQSAAALETTNSAPDGAHAASSDEESDVLVPMGEDEVLEDDEGATYTMPAPNAPGSNAAASGAGVSTGASARRRVDFEPTTRQEVWNGQTLTVVPFSTIRSMVFGVCIDLPRWCESQGLLRTTSHPSGVPVINLAVTDLMGGKACAHPGFDGSVKKVAPPALGSVTGLAGETHPGGAAPVTEGSGRRGASDVDVPSKMVLPLVQLVHGSSASLPALIKSFQEQVAGAAQLSKKRIEQWIRNNAVKGRWGLKQRRVLPTALSSTTETETTSTTTTTTATLPVSPGATSSSSAPVTPQQPLRPVAASPLVPGSGSGSGMSAVPLEAYLRASLVAEPAGPAEAFTRLRYIVNASVLKECGYEYPKEVLEAALVLEENMTRKNGIAPQDDGSVESIAGGKITIPSLEAALADKHATKILDFTLNAIAAAGASSTAAASATADAEV